VQDKKKNPRYRWFVVAVFYPLWGYLYDRYARSKLLSLAAFIWVSTTWLNALAPLIAGVIATASLL
jgi:hypothetical protein